MMLQLRQEALAIASGSNSSRMTEAQSATKQTLSNLENNQATPSPGTEVNNGAHRSASQRTTDNLRNLMRGN